MRFRVPSAQPRALIQHSWGDAMSRACFRLRGLGFSVQGAGLRVLPEHLWLLGSGESLGKRVALQIRPLSGVPYYLGDPKRDPNYTKPRNLYPEP